MINQQESSKASESAALARAPRGIEAYLKPQRVVVIQHPAVKTEVKYRGLSVFLQSSGDSVRDERNAKQFSERISKLCREWENTVLGLNYGPDL